MIETEALSAKHIARWQERQLPLMMTTIVTLGGFFFAATLWQLVTLQERIVQQRPEWTSATTAASVRDDRLRLLGAMEAEAVSRRHHLASSLLTGRVWQLYLGFVTGMILSFVGAVFVLGKLQEPESEAALESRSVKAALRSSSPGVMLAGLGVALMVTTIVTNLRIQVEDRPQYLIETLPARSLDTWSKPQLPDFPTGSLPSDSNGLAATHD
jgi:hypothetical protein